VEGEVRRRSDRAARGKGGQWCVDLREAGVRRRRVGEGDGRWVGWGMGCCVVVLLWKRQEAVAILSWHVPSSTPKAGW
jgi:hypothetical protein